MKHLPNLLTLANLFCGCIAITFILAAQNFTTSYGIFDYIEVPAIEQPYWGSLFIFLAAIFDIADGWSARALGVYSPLGKDLDSLADVVSFGVAPSMILFKLLWSAYMMKPEAMDVSVLAMSPAFLIACFGALRLARYNVASGSHSSSFKGLPIPAVGLLVASFPLVMWQNPYNAASLFSHTWLLYLLIVILCWLMVSNIRFFKFIPQKWRLSELWPQFVIIIAGVVSFVFLKWGAIAIAIFVYVILSLIYKAKET